MGPFSCNPLGKEMFCKDKPIGKERVGVNQYHCKSGFNTMQVHCLTALQARGQTQASLD